MGERRVRDKTGPNGVWIVGVQASGKDADERCGGKRGSAGRRAPPASQCYRENAWGCDFGGDHEAAKELCWQERNNNSPASLVKVTSDVCMDSGRSLSQGILVHAKLRFNIASGKTGREVFVSVKLGPSSATNGGKRSSCSNASGKSRSLPFCTTASPTPPFWSALRPRLSATRHLMCTRRRHAEAT